MASIKLENVYKNFGKTTALKNLNIEIFNGEFFVLLGPTGAGKTTTLRIISGLEQPDRGKIFFDKEIMNDVQPAFRDTSYVFQQFSLIFCLCWHHFSDVFGLRSCILLSLFFRSGRGRKKRYLARRLWVCIYFPSF